MAKAGNLEPDEEAHTARGRKSACSNAAVGDNGGKPPMSYPKRTTIAPWQWHPATLSVGNMHRTTAIRRDMPAKLVDFVRRESARWKTPRGMTRGGEIVPTRMVCELGDRAASSDDLRNIVGAVPRDLETFWSAWESANLFVDIDYGRWGLEILSPERSMIATLRFMSDRSRDFRMGDLVVGRFLGAGELLVCRRYRADADFGQLLVAVPIEARDKWPCAAGCFGEFLERYFAGDGDKYWEPHMQDVGGMRRHEY